MFGRRHDDAKMEFPQNVYNKKRQVAISNARDCDVLIPVQLIR